MPRPWQGLEGITVQPGGEREKQKSKREARISSRAGALWGFHLDPPLSTNPPSAMFTKLRSILWFHRQVS